MSKRVVIAGGTGGVGKVIQNHLSKRLNDKVDFVILSREPDKQINSNTTLLNWDTLKAKSLPDADAVINLTGANIFSNRWTEERKKVLYESRIDTTNLLVEKMKENAPKRFVSASAIGIYPTSTATVYNEDTEIPTKDLTFAQELVMAWEQAALGRLAEATKNAEVALPDTTTTIIRIGFVVGKDQPAMKQMLIPFKLGLGGPIGTGNQPFGWIHQHDLSEMFYQASFGEAKGGIVNGVAPDVITQGQFANTLGKVVNRPTFIPAPAFVLRILLQERANLLLEGTKIRPDLLPARLPEFEYTYGDLEHALKEVVSKK